MIKIGIFNQTEEDLSKELKTVRKVLQQAAKIEQLKNIECNVIIARDEDLHELNRTYRGIDCATDVITFALEDEKKVVLPEHYRVLGDIYISLDRAHGQAVEYGHSFLREICFLAVHGFFHLLGYDHQTKEEEEIMFQKQEEVLESYGIKR